MVRVAVFCSDAEELVKYLLTSMLLQQMLLRLYTHFLYCPTCPHLKALST